MPNVTIFSQGPIPKQSSFQAEFVFHFLASKYFSCVRELLIADSPAPGGLPRMGAAGMSYLERANAPALGMHV